MRCAIPKTTWPNSTSNAGKRKPICGSSRPRLSLSRLNHRQPRIQAHPEIVQGATDLHHHITNTFFPQTHAVFDDTTALDTAVDMLDPQPPLIEYLIGQVLLQGE